MNFYEELQTLKNNDTLAWPWVFFGTAQLKMVSPLERVYSYGIQSMLEL